MKLKAYLVTDKNNEPFWVHGFTFIYLKPPEINPDDQILHEVTITDKTTIKTMWDWIRGRV